MSLIDHDIFPDTIKLASPIVFAFTCKRISFFRSSNNLLTGGLEICCCGYSKILKELIHNKIFSQIRSQLNALFIEQSVELTWKILGSILFWILL